MLGRINIYLKEERAVKIFKCFLAAKLPSKGGVVRHSKAKQHGITVDECQHLLRKISLELNAGKEMSDIIFDKLFGTEKQAVTADEFLVTFVLQKQQEKEVTIDNVKALFSELNRKKVPGREKGQGHEETIDRSVFREYLASSRNDLYDPAAQTFDPSSLTAPLSAYCEKNTTWFAFISAPHPLTFQTLPLCCRDKFQPQYLLDGRSTHIRFKC